MSQIVRLNQAQTKAVARLFKKIDIASLSVEGGELNNGGDVWIRVEDHYGWSATVKLAVDGHPEAVRTGKGIVFSEETLQELFVNELYKRFLEVPGVDSD